MKIVTPLLHAIGVVFLALFGMATAMFIWPFSHGRAESLAQKLAFWIREKRENFRRAHPEVPWSRCDIG